MICLFDSFFINTLTFVFIVIFPVYYFCTKNASHWKDRGVKYVPLFKCAMWTFFGKSDLFSINRDIYDMFPDEQLVGAFVFTRPCLQFKGPSLIHRVLTKDFECFTDRGTPIDERIDLFASNLIDLPGQKWKTLRKKLTPVFSSGKLKMMCTHLGDCVKLLSDYLASAATDEDSVDMKQIMSRFSSDVIGACAFGVALNSLSDPSFRQIGDEATKTSFRLLLRSLLSSLHPDIPYYLNLKILRPEKTRLFLDFVKNAMDQADEGFAKRVDFIKILTDLRNEDLLKNSTEDNSFVLTDRVIAANAYVFYIGGFETMATTMSLALLELAAHPAVQEAVRAEVTRALNVHGGHLDYDTIKHLPYMDTVILETLRKYPPFYFLLRKCTQTYHIPESSVVVDKGTELIIPIFCIHRDPTHFPDPERFDPERFSPERKANIAPGSFLPFGEGPHSCIGQRFAMMQIKYAFCEVLPKYRFIVTDKTEYPVTFKPGFLPMLCPRAIWLQVTPL